MIGLHLPALLRPRAAGWFAAVPLAEPAHAHSDTIEWCSACGRCVPEGTDRLTFIGMGYELTPYRLAATADCTESDAVAAEFGEQELRYGGSASSDEVA